MNNRIEKYETFFAEIHKKMIKEDISPLLKKTENKESKLFYDPNNNTLFSGINKSLLQNVSSFKGYSDPRWINRKDMDKLGVRPNKGEKGLVLAFTEGDNKLFIDKSNNNKKVVLERFYNADQILGKEKIKENPKIKDIGKMKKISLEDNLKQNKDKNILKELVEKSNTPLKNTSYATALFDIQRDTGKTYTPINSDMIVSENEKASNSDIMKSYYYGHIQSEKMTQPNLGRTLTEEQQRELEAKKVKLRKETEKGLGR